MIRWLDEALGFKSARNLGASIANRNKEIKNEIQGIREDFAEMQKYLEDKSREDAGGDL